MTHTAPSISGPEILAYEAPLKNEAQSSGVSWAAVAAGAFVAAALSLILVALGSGIGLSFAPPWSNANVSPSTVRGASIIWLIIVQIVASAFGGYLAGRLRTKWVDVHTDEVYFRDTAHGLLVWAVGLVITAAFLASATASMVGGSVNSVQPGVRDDPGAYFVDSLFRSDRPGPVGNDGSAQTEAGRILVNAIRQGNLPAADKSYLVGLVAAKTGMDRNDADARVSMVFDEDRQAADTARKEVAHSLYWLFLALLIGAFCSSYAATVGGKQRDRLRVV